MEDQTDKLTEKETPKYYVDKAEMRRFFLKLESTPGVSTSTKLFCMYWKFATDSEDGWLSIDNLVKDYKRSERTILKYFSEIRKTGLLYEKWHPEQRCKIYSLM